MSDEVVEAIPLPAILVASDGRVSVANPGAKKLFGDAIDGRHYITVLRQPSVLDAVDQALSSGKTTVSKYLTTEARTDVTLKTTCAPLPSGKLLIVFEDHTPLQAAVQSRRNFVANVSHELRTPLTALTGFIDTLRGAARDDPEARDRFLGIMAREAGRMNRLVADLLSLSRVEADERVRPTSQVDLSEVVSSVIGTLTPIADDAGVTITYDGLDQSAVMFGDADQLSQVVTNLLENAIKYSGEGQSVALDLAYETDNALLRGDAWVLNVVDTGDGIEAEHIPRLTERFYRVDSHRSRELGGTGLGLAIVKHIVNRHRGRLRIQSEKGKGSRFTVILPAATAPHNSSLS